MSMVHSTYCGQAYKLAPYEIPVPRIEGLRLDDILTIPDAARNRQFAVQQVVATFADGEEQNGVMSYDACTYVNFQSSFRKALVDYLTKAYTIFH